MKDKKEKRVIIQGIFLAAGSSQRMGKNKLELPFRDTTLGSYSLKNCLTSNLSHTFVVTKEQELNHWINDVLYLEPYCEKWKNTPCSYSHLGQSFSIKCGLKEAMNKGAEAIIVILADQPLVTKEMINTLIEEFMKKETVTSEDLHFIASSFGGLLRPPILFTKKAYPYLLQLEGDQGARQIIRENIDFNGYGLEFESEDLFLDIDTGEDYAKIMNN